MALPCYLAMTPAELSSDGPIPPKIAWMACHFSPWSQGLTNIPDALPPGSMLILNDRMPCQGHCPELVLQQLSEAVEKLGCGSVLLDFQRPPEPESAFVAKTLAGALPCPTAVFESYAAELDCPVFLPPCPLHLPIREHLSPWNGREVWLEAALCQEDIIVTSKGVSHVPQFPPEHLEEGFFEENLLCRYRTKVADAEVRFTLFDTRESLEKKLEQAEALGVTKAVGLYQELVGSE